MPTISSFFNSPANIPIYNPEPPSLSSQIENIGMKAAFSVQAGVFTAIACDSIRQTYEQPAKDYAFDTLPYGKRLEHFELDSFRIVTVHEVLFPVIIFSASGGLTDLYNLGISLAKSIYDRTCSYFSPANTDTKKNQ